MKENVCGCFFLNTVYTLILYQHCNTAQWRKPANEALTRKLP